MRRPCIRAVAAVAVSILATISPGLAAEEAPASPVERHLAAIAAALERIEQNLGGERVLRIVELRFKRLDLLRAELAPLESELRNLRTNDSYFSPEVKIQEEQLRMLTKQIEEAELGGEPELLRSLEMQRRNAELQLRSCRERSKSHAERAEELEAQLAVLRADRDAAVAEIERLLAWLENQSR